MSKSPGLIERLRTERPATWALLKLAALDNLVVIDEEADSVQTTNRILTGDPGLRDTLSTLVDSWAEHSPTCKKPSKSRPKLRTPSRPDPGAPLAIAKG